MKNLMIRYRRLPLCLMLALNAWGVTQRAWAADGAVTQIIPTNTSDTADQTVDPQMHTETTSVSKISTKKDLPSQMDFVSALHQVEQYSPKLAAAKAEVQSKELQRDAAKFLGGPNVLLTADAIKYHVHYDVDLTQAKQDIAQAGNNVISTIPGLSNILQQVPIKIPDTYELDKTNHYFTKNAVVFWPVFTGGRIHAVKGILSARAQEAQAEATMTHDEVYVTLVQRYFGAQLASLAADLRTAAASTIAAHDHAAERMLQEGLISNAERLRAKVALEDAKRQQEKANSDAQLAKVALQRLLQGNQVVNPSTPIFVLSHPLQPLDYFQNLAMQHHPGLEKVAAKKEQAERLLDINNGRYLPAVNVYGMHELSTHKPSWVVGVNANWTLWSGLDRQRMSESAEKQVMQAEYTDQQVRDDILLLVEKNWRSAEDARTAYLALNTNIDLARELVRLQRSSVREGLATVPDLMTAETQYFQALTEQAKAGNDYVQALAQLLDSCGTPEAFTDYAAKADVRLKASSMAAMPTVNSVGKAAKKSVRPNAKAQKAVPNN